MNFLMTDAVCLTAMSGMFVLLTVASVITGLFRKLRPEKDVSEVVLRIKTWWAIVLMFCVVMVSGRAASIGFFAFLSFIALKEYLSLIPARQADRQILFWVYLAIPVQYWCIYSGWDGMFIIFIPVGAFLFLPMGLVMTGETRGFLYAAGSLHWGLMTTVFSLSNMAYLLVLPGVNAFTASGPRLVIYLV